MIKTIRIKNYKSIEKLKVDIGQFTVFIGENGSGKSNILEAAALASASVNNKLDNEFLSSRGIRVTDPKFMRSAFNGENTTKEIFIKLEGDDDISFTCRLKNDNKPYSIWQVVYDEPLDKLKALIEKSNGNWQEKLTNYVNTEKLDTDNNRLIESIVAQITKRDIEIDLKFNLRKFLIYSPENFSLRIFEREGQIEPLGINGEGLFKLLKVLSSEDSIDKLKLIKEKLKFIDWFKDFEIPKQLSGREKSIRIEDKYLDRDLEYFDQKSSNEGFLFLLFYFSLFISDDTPDCFAIDNIDASLNPKLCSQLTKELVNLGKKFNKQAIVTTHNPAILDGLNLDDPEQKLYVVFRNKLGYTKVKQIQKPETPPDQEPVKLSEAFLRGYIGGLPKGF